jgi:SAM-dependent methyltransferase
MLTWNKQEMYRRRYALSRPGYRTGGQVFEALLLRHLAGARRVLDAGCGRAGILQDHHGEVPFLVGTDADLASLGDNARLHAGTLADLHALPFADASFDMVGSTWVMEHLEEPEEAFREMGRVLSPGGHLLVLAPNAWSLVTLINRATPGRLQAGLVRRAYGRESQDTFPVVYAANTRHRLARLARAGGLREAEFHYVGDPSYLAINPLLYRASVLVERITDWQPLRRFKVHLVGDYVRE